MLSPASNAAQQPSTQPRHFASLFPPAKHLPDYAVAQWREQLRVERASRRLGGSR